MRSQDFLEVLTRETDWQGSKTSTTLDSESLRKILRARARETRPEIPHSQLRQSAPVRRPPCTLELLSSRAQKTVGPAARTLRPQLTARHRRTMATAPFFTQLLLLSVRAQLAHAGASTSPSDLLLNAAAPPGRGWRSA
jgi:hypothetical protein